MITKEMLEKEFYSIKEVAEKMGKSIRQINTLAAEGRFEGAFKFSQGWLIPKTALDKFVYKPRGFAKGTHTKKIKAKRELADWLERYESQGTKVQEKE